MSVVVFDLDGTLADSRHRRPYLPVNPVGPRDWIGYFAECADDAPIPGPIALARLLGAHHEIVIVTARPDVPALRNATGGWLARYDVPCTALHMIPLDATSVSAWKAGVVAGLGPVALAIDDHWKNVDALTAAELPVLHVVPPGLGRPVAKSTRAMA